MWTKTHEKSHILLVAMLLLAGTAATSSADDKSDKANKPLAGYSTLLVDKFTVDKNAATEEFPGGQEVVMQKSSIARLREKKAFSTIIDMTEPEQQSSEAGKSVRLSGTVVTYDKGSRAARWVVGFGAGAAKVKVRFVFTDADTNEVLFRVDRQGKYYGFIGFVGGSQEQATSEAAGDVVDGLIKEIEKRR